MGLVFVARIGSLHAVDVSGDVNAAETPPVAEAEADALGSVAEMGRQLFGPFALPFEIASLVLLAAIVGAVVLARRRGT